jgi:5-methylcytosine-specific restriction enzyme A
MSNLGKLLMSGERMTGRPWRRLREAVLMRDGYLCQPCQRRGRLTAAREVDHRKALANGGTNDPANLEGICRPCHAAKTASDARGGRLVGCDVDGWPDSPDHHWNK